MTSPFAAAAQPYGDNRCGFATDSTGDQQQQQQQQQLAVPSLQEAELLLQQLPGQDAGAADSQLLQEWRQRWSAVAPAVAGLEQLASAATLQYMDAQGEPYVGLLPAVGALPCCCSNTRGRVCSWSRRPVAWGTVATAHVASTPKHSSRTSMHIPPPSSHFDAASADAEVAALVPVGADMPACSACFVCAGVQLCLNHRRWSGVSVWAAGPLGAAAQCSQHWPLH